MNTKFTFAVMVALVLLQGCAGTSSVGFQEREYSDVSEFKTTGKAVARAANDVGPDINDINTCPPGMGRTDHTAGGSADSNIKVTEQGTKFQHNVEFGQSHNCK